MLTYMQACSLLRAISLYELCRYLQRTSEFMCIRHHRAAACSFAIQGASGCNQSDAGGSSKDQS